MTRTDDTNARNLLGKTIVVWSWPPRRPIVIPWNVEEEKLARKNMLANCPWLRDCGPTDDTTEATE